MTDDDAANEKQQLPSCSEVDAQHGHLPRLGLHILQISAVASFLPAAVLAAVLGRWIGFATLVGNCITSIAAHRLVRQAATDASDRIDYVSIAVWVAYCTGVVIQLSAVLLPDHAPSWRLVLLALAIVGAAGTGACDVKRRSKAWRTRERNGFHALMHLAGGLGTLSLLFASVGVDVVVRV